ncbi:YlbF family regulator [Vagococcus fluvialis]|uniref:YlbF family regulator n=1 Tax=Vagococcus fluvialis TaxID=2738 RepID=UPI0037D1BB42
MIFNETVFEVESILTELSNSINESQLVADYISSYHVMNKSDEVAKLKKEFKEVKEVFEKIEPYGKYAPDFKEKRRAVRKVKRELDINELVSNFKFNETSLQNMLDYITFDIAKSISDDIKIDAGNPFFEFAKRGCGGSCHVG